MAELANQYGINLGNILSTAEAVKESRQRRDINQLKLNSVKSQMAEQEAMKEWLAANPDAPLRETVARFPNVAGPVVEAYGKASKADQEAMVTNALGTVQILDRLFAAPPEQRPQVYMQMRSTLPESIKKLTPEQYDEQGLQAMRNWSMQIAGGKELLVKREANKLALSTEELKQKNRMALEGAKQGGREKLQRMKGDTKSPTNRLAIEKEARAQVQNLYKSQDRGAGTDFSFVFDSQKTTAEAQRVLNRAVQKMQNGEETTVSSAVLSAYDEVQKETDTRSDTDKFKSKLKTLYNQRAQ